MSQKQRHYAQASSSVMLPPAVWSGRPPSWRQVTFTWGTMDNSLFTVCLRKRQQSKGISFTSTLPGSHRKLDPDAVAFSIILLPAGTWRGVPSTYRYQEILSSMEPPSRFCMGIHAELYLPTFRLSMFCLYSPNWTWTLDAYVVQKNSKEFLSQIFLEDMAADLAAVSRRCMANLWEQFLTYLYESAQKLFEI